jgi:hypothetical protein
VKLHLIRLVLLRREQGEIFTEWEGRLPTREEWLRLIFSRRIDFIHRKVPFYYVPEETDSPEYLAGRIGRQRVSRENEPPEAGLGDTARQQWKAIRLVIDPRHHDDGQKVAVEASHEIGRPAAVMRSLASTLNTQIPPEPYAMEATGIVDPATFWRFVEENEGDIVTVTFEMFAPNMFGIRSNLDQEMRDLKANEKAQRVEITLENEEGLHLNTDRTRQTAEYTAEGGGNITAATKSGRTFSSKNKAKSFHVVADEVLSSAKDVLRTIWDRMRQP